MWKSPVVEVIDFSTFATARSDSNAVGCDHISCC